MCISFKIFVVKLYGSLRRVILLAVVRFLWFYSGFSHLPHSFLDVYNM